MEEVDYPKDYENLQTKPVLDPFKSTAPHRKVRELPQKMNIEEVEEPETMKIYRQNPFTPVAATRKLWEFTHETNMQARNHENSDEICAQPVRHLDLATPAFYHYRKNPKCYHTVWGKSVCVCAHNTFVYIYTHWSYNILYTIIIDLILYISIFSTDFRTTEENDDAECSRSFLQNVSMGSLSNRGWRSR